SGRDSRWIEAHAALDRRCAFCDLDDQATNRCGHITYTGAGQNDAQLGAAARPLSGLDRAIVALDELFDERESDSRAHLVAIARATFEAAEQARREIGVDAGAGIEDRQANAVAFLYKLELDRAAARRV